MDYVQAFRGIVTPDLSDACDALGIEAVTSGAIHAVYPNCPVICGPAVTYRLRPGATGSTVIGTIEGIVSAKPGSILVFDVDGNMELNAWGSIAGNTAVQYRMGGVVIDGVTRDVQAMQELSLPTYARGTCVTSVRGRIGLESLNEPITMFGKEVHPGWVCAADANGVIFFPPERSKEVFDFAYRVVALERKVVQQIQQGVDPIEAHKVMKYDVSWKDQLNDKGLTK
jgi:4-hydroxy-4-methyl-2-oxoglutarate aldolase